MRKGSDQNIPLESSILVGSFIPVGVWHFSAKRAAAVSIKDFSPTTKEKTKSGQVIHIIYVMQKSKICDPITEKVEEETFLGKE